MKQISQIFSKFSALRAQKGFTMIELLIVIAILGILAVAVLSAINPLEQINRGRDTSSQSDAEQLLNAIERFNAFQSHFPWDLNENSTSTAINTLTHVEGPAGTTPWIVTNNGADICNVLDRLGDGGAQDCANGADEVKQSFVNRVGGFDQPRGLYIYKADASPSTNIYVCFVPQSGAFSESARSTCTQTLPTDHPGAQVCGTGAGTPAAAGITDADGNTGVYMSCLP